jgi:hypothetical protein
MAETNPARLTPASGMDHVGGVQPTGWTTATAGHTVRHDAELHLPLTDPRMPDPDSTSPSPSPPEPPSEHQRRQALADAVEARTAALAALETVQERHLRAQQYREECATAVATFDGLGEAINAATLEGLRSESGKPDLTPFNARITERELAQAALNGADAALTTLAQEHQQATAWWQSAVASEKQAVHHLLDLERARLRQEQKQLEQSVDAFGQIIGWPDTHARWQAVAERLLSDPLHADLDVGEVPDAPVVEPPAPSTVNRYSGTAVIRNPDGTSETVDQQTMFGRLREARQQQARPYFELEAEARARAAQPMLGKR